MCPKDLNVFAVRYAINTLFHYEPSWPAFNRLLDLYCSCYNDDALTPYCSEAVMRTQGMTLDYVVASRGIVDRDIVYSDYSGKKQRSTVLKDFPKRKSDFKEWYGSNSKPYQHRALYEHIVNTLGTIGSIKNGVAHPIGYCAEQNVANRLMLDDDAPIDKILFSDAIRPRTGEVVDFCNNCKALFNQLNDAKKQGIS